jgi:pimeloyl-ACP methyl ester carboxylesterase
VQDYINEKFKGRRVTLVGESFGGLLATAVAASHSTSPSLNVVLVNPATSFQSTNWKTLAPVLTSTVGKTSAYPFVGGGVLAATVPSLYQSKKLTKELISDFTADPLSIPTKGQELLNMFAESINKRLPPDVVKFRVLEWCEVGSKKVRVESGFPGNFITCS